MKYMFLTLILLVGISAHAQYYPQWMPQNQVNSLNNNQFQPAQPVQPIPNMGMPNNQNANEFGPAPYQPIQNMQPRVLVNPGGF
jgi:hypothetical protein